MTILNKRRQVDTYSFFLPNIIRILSLNNYGEIFNVSNQGWGELDRYKVNSFVNFHYIIHWERHWEKKGFSKQTFWWENYSSFLLHKKMKIARQKHWFFWIEHFSTCSKGNCYNIAMCFSHCRCDCRNIISTRSQVSKILCINLNKNICVTKIIHSGIKMK